MSIRTHVEDLNNMILSGQVLDAFDKYYDDKVVMQDNEGEPRVGKPANRQYEEQFVEALETFHGAEVRNLAVDEATGTAMIEWWMDMSLKGMGRVQRHQVAIQKWQDGRIVHEQFLYPN